MVCVQAGGNHARSHERSVTTADARVLLPSLKPHRRVPFINSAEVQAARWSHCKPTMYSRCLKQKRCGPAFWPAATLVVLRHVQSDTHPPVGHAATWPGSTEQVFQPKDDGSMRCKQAAMAASERCPDENADSWTAEILTWHGLAARSYGWRTSGGQTSEWRLPTRAHVGIAIPACSELT